MCNSVLFNLEIYEANKFIDTLPDNRDRSRLKDLLSLLESTLSSQSTTQGDSGDIEDYISTISDLEDMISDLEDENESLRNKISDGR